MLGEAGFDRVTVDLATPVLGDLDRHRRLLNLGVGFNLENADVWKQLVTADRQEPLMGAMLKEELPPPWSFNFGPGWGLKVNKVLEAHPQLEKFIGRFRARTQSVSEASEVAHIHYDLSAYFYELILGPSMAYSCPYQPDLTQPFDLDSAQRRKQLAPSFKLNLQPGMKVVEFGSGFGSNADLIQEVSGADIVGLTISEEQCRYAQEHYGRPGLEFRVQDYRALEEGGFDAVYSVGMFEHVHPLNYREYFKIASRVSTPEASFLLHTIGNNNMRSKTNPWLDKYVFPGGLCPHRAQLLWGLYGSDYHIHDWHAFGKCYALALKEWRSKLLDSQIKEVLRKKDPQRFNDHFFRTFEIYFAGCEAMFDSPLEVPPMDLWQLVLSKKDSLELPVVRDWPI